MLPSETMIWQPEFTDKTLSRKPGAVHSDIMSEAFSLTKWTWGVMVKKSLDILAGIREDVSDIFGF
ncbi:hypothetical protein [Escherichia coli]|uniref:hypothetical protein n=1 Tax=Escherichia coli TaxID=562 RepID=UPI000DF3A3E9|nr:hypothetical protein [Escherichia coli]RCQ99938.1 hypothetical protein A6578_24555 [Escherichia coli]